jgi:hypothetical protein
MSARTSSINRLVLGAVLLHAPALAAQGLALAPAFSAGEARSAPAPSLVSEGTDNPVDLPCDRQPQSPELALARERPEILVWRVLWEIRAHHTIETLEAPLPICFAANRSVPDRMFQNVIRFNSEWMAGPERRHLAYVLSGYAAARENTGREPGLGAQRASDVRQRSGSNLQRRLTVHNGGVSDAQGKARWVEYILTRR